MVISPLQRKLLRDLVRIRMQAMAIALVIAAGMTVFIMSLGTVRSLDETRAAYYERYRFPHLFAHVKRGPQWLVSHIRRIGGVRSVDARILVDVSLDVEGMDEPAIGRIASLPEQPGSGHSLLTLFAGRHAVPGRSDEVLVSKAFATEHGFGPGDTVAATINGRKRTLDIVGVAQSPEFIYTIAPGGLVPDDRRFGILWMGREALAAAFDLEGAFNDVTVILLPSASEPDVIAKLDRLLEPYGGVGATGREDQISDWWVSNEIDQLRTMSRYLPAIFLAVAAYLLHMVTGRIIATEREQIGLLKAVGYTKPAIGAHYLQLVMLIVMLGLALGFLGGYLMGRWQTQIYGDLLDFPLLLYRPGTAVFGTAALVGVAAGVVGTLNAVRKATALSPTEAMSPPVPTLYRRRRSLMAAFVTLFDQPTRMMLRHLTRWPLRTGFTVLGLSLAVAVNLASLHWFDAVEHLMSFQFFQAQRQDVTISFVDPKPARIVHEGRRLSGVIDVEPFRSVPVRFRHGTRTRLGAITGVDDDVRLVRPLDIESHLVNPPPGRIVLSLVLAERLEVEPGDEIIVEVKEGRRPTRTLTVADVIDTYIGFEAYMGLPSLNRMMREAPVVSGLHFTVDRSRQDEMFRELKDLPEVAAVASITAALQSFRETLAESMYIMIGFLCSFGAIIAFGVTYNSARINLSERARELASLRVMGFTRFEVAYILLGELVVLTVLALPLGCLFGFALSWVLTLAFNNELFRVPMVIAPATYGVAMGILLVMTLVSGLAIMGRINRLNLISALKTRE